MEIHKPKPWHTVREFLKEYAIIVLSVITALAAEQAVEWLNWQHLSPPRRPGTTRNSSSLQKCRCAANTTPRNWNSHRVMALPC